MLVSRISSISFLLNFYYELFKLFRVNYFLIRSEFFVLYFFLHVSFLKQILKVGLACVQLAVRMGVVVFGTAGTEQGLQLVKQNGAEQVFNHRKSDYIKEIMVT